MSETPPGDRPDEPARGGGSSPLPGDDSRREDGPDAVSPAESADPFAFVPDERDRRESAPEAPRADDDDPSGATEPPSDADRPSDAEWRSDPDSDAPRDVVLPPRFDITGREIARDAGRRWVVAVVVLLVLVVGVSLLTFYNGRNSSNGVQVGDSLPPFAAPLATAPKLENDAVNYAANAESGDAGRVAACSIDDPAVITSCALLRQGPMVFVMFALGVDECVRTVDDLDRVRADYPAVRTLAVAIGGTHAKTAAAVRNRRWRLPVAYDRDGGLSSRLGAPACPYVLFVDADGTVTDRRFGATSAADLARGMARLTADATAAVPTSPSTTTPRATSSGATSPGPGTTTPTRTPGATSTTTPAPGR